MMTETVADHAAQVTTYAGASSAAVFWGLQISDIGVIVSALVAVLGFCLHVWLSLRRERREQQQHRLVMEKMSGAKTSDVAAGQGDGGRD
jgi:hypothetical protein